MLDFILKKGEVMPLESKILKLADIYYDSLKAVAGMTPKAHEGIEQCKAELAGAIAREGADIDYMKAENDNFQYIDFPELKDLFIERFVLAEKGVSVQFSLDSDIMSPLRARRYPATYGTMPVRASEGAINSVKDFMSMYRSESKHPVEYEFRRRLDKDYGIYRGVTISFNDGIRIDYSKYARTYPGSIYWAGENEHGFFRFETNDDYLGYYFTPYFDCSAIKCKLAYFRDGLITGDKVRDVKFPYEILGSGELSEFFRFLGKEF